MEKIEENDYPIDYRKISNSGFFIFRGDVISISRDINYSSNYQEGFDNDSLALKKQKFIRIVRIEDERGISIILRGRGNAKPLREKDGEVSRPISD